MEGLRTHILQQPDHELEAGYDPPAPFTAVAVAVAVAVHGGGPNEVGIGIHCKKGIESVRPLKVTCEKRRTLVLIRDLDVIHEIPLDSLWQALKAEEPAHAGTIIRGLERLEKAEVSDS